MRTQRSFRAIACLAVAVPIGAQTIAKFELKERFGVSHPEQPVELTYTGEMVDPGSTVMLGPGDEAVPLQQLSNRNILIRTALPASKLATTYSASQVDPKTDSVSINLNMLSAAYPVTGEVVRFEGSDLPGGLE